jgi:hypothetical protein
VEFAMSECCTRYGVRPEVFVVAWEGSDNVQDVAVKIEKKTGVVVPTKTLSARAYRYRHIGINLKKF